MNETPIRCPVRQYTTLLSFLALLLSIRTTPLPTKQAHTSTAQGMFRNTHTQKKLSTQYNYRVSYHTSKTPNNQNPTHARTLSSSKPHQTNREIKPNNKEPPQQIHTTTPLSSPLRNEQQCVMTSVTVRDWCPLRCS